MTNQAKVRVPRVRKDSYVSASWRLIHTLKKVAFLIDMDGVVYRGSDPIPGAVTFLHHLVEHNHPFLLVTNNSAYTPQMLHARLVGMGIRIPQENIYTSAMATAAWLKSKGYAQILALGEVGLMEALEDAGVAGDRKPSSSGVPGDGPEAVGLGSSLPNQAPDCIVMGELRSLDYSLLCRVTEYASAGVPLVGTNPDLVIPKESGLDIGCGAVLGMIEQAAGRKAEYIGKPHPTMFKTAIERLGVSPSSIVVIGDSMDTDILGAHNLGLRSVLVFSGLSTPKDSTSRPHRPTWTAQHVGELIPMLSAMAEGNRAE